MHIDRLLPAQAAQYRALMLDASTAHPDALAVGNGYVSKVHMWCPLDEQRIQSAPPISGT
jgi:hypothetical protein